MPQMCPRTWPRWRSWREPELVVVVPALMVETDVAAQDRRLQACVAGQRTLKGLILLWVDFWIFYCGVGHVVGAL